jgi:hypothetical protein
MKIEPGEVVITVLHTPREKLIGILEEISPAGMYLRAVDLSYFDDWSRSIAAGEDHLPMSDYFLPMWRLERVMRDEGSPSMAEQFEQRTGRKTVGSLGDAPPERLMPILPLLVTRLTVAPPSPSLAVIVLAP